MAVTIDLGHPTDVHPRRKAPVGERLARLALAATYGRDVVPTGPLFRSQQIDGSRIRVHFDHAAGLRTSDGEPVRCFAVAGKDRVYRPAKATIDGQDVVVTAPGVAAPVAVRYAYENDPDTNLVNTELLPASPFRTDTWAYRAALPESNGCSFENARLGPLLAATTGIGRFSAAPGHAEITQRFARTGKTVVGILWSATERGVGRAVSWTVRCSRNSVVERVAPF